MDEMGYYVPALEEKYSQRIMLSLLSNPRQKKTELLQSISKSSCMSRRLDSLVDAGFVSIQRDTFEFNTQWVTLTPRGMKVAELLGEIMLVASE